MNNTTDIENITRRELLKNSAATSALIGAGVSLPGNVVAAQSENPEAGVHDGSAPFLEFSIEFPDIDDGSVLAANKPHPSFVKQGNRVYLPDSDVNSISPSADTPVIASHIGIQSIDPPHEIKLDSVPVFARSDGHSEVLRKSDVKGSVVVEKVTGTRGQQGKPSVNIQVADESYQLKVQESIQETQQIGVEYVKYKDEEDWEKVDTTSEAAVKIAYHGTVNFVSHDSKILYPKKDSRQNKVRSKMNEVNSNSFKVPGQNNSKGVKVTEIPAFKAYAFERVAEEED